MGDLSELGPTAPHVSPPALCTPPSSWEISVSQDSLCHPSISWIPCPCPKFPHLYPQPLHPHIPTLAPGCALQLHPPSSALCRAVPPLLHLHPLWAVSVLACVPLTSPLSPPGLLASFKLPAYEEVAQRPGTPPPPYSPGSPSLSPGSSGGCSSCSCGCSCASSPSSSSLSAPGTDETDPEPGPGPGGGSTGRDGGSSSTGTGASWDLPLPEEPPAYEGPPKQVPPDFCEAEGRPCSDIERGEDGGGRAVLGDCSGRHRRLTGDSGIEVGRGLEEDEGEPEGCGGPGGDGGPGPPVLPV